MTNPIVQQIQYPFIKIPENKMGKIIETSDSRIIFTVLKHAFSRKSNLNNQIADFINNIQSSQIPFFIITNKESFFFRFINKDGLLRTPAKIQKLIEERQFPTEIHNTYKLLENKIVGIIGLGSLGSHIAISLIKNGIKEIILWDYDLLEPKNIHRHILNTNFNYLHKVYGMTQHINSLFPDIKVTPVPYSPFSPSIAGDFNDRVSKIDIIIAAGLNYRSQRLLNEIIVEQNAISIYSSVNYNATCGEIYRVVPNQTACWECIRLQREDSVHYPNIFGEGDPMDLPNYDTAEWPGMEIDINVVATAGLLLSNIS